MTTVETISAPRESRWTGTLGIKRPSLQNLLLGLRPSSWSSTATAVPSSEESTFSASTSSTDPTIGIASLPNTAGAAPLEVAVNSTNAAAASVAVADEDNEVVGGGKNIDFWGSVALLFNNVTGGSMVLFAQLYQQAGWVLPTLCLLLLMVVSGLGGLMFIECIALLPRNGSFGRRIEYSTVIKHYFHPWAYVIVAVFYQLSLTVTNLSLIIQSVQVMDFTITAIAGKTCGAPQLYPTVAFVCPDPVEGNITPFDTDVFVVSLGLYFTALMVIPLALLNLDDNIKVQKGAFVSLLVIVLVWIGILSAQSPSIAYVPAVGSTLAGVIGTSLFNFAFITSVPSWINEKREHISIVKVFAVSLPLTVCTFISLGWLGGAAFAPWTSTETLLDQMKGTGVLGNITFYLFPMIANLTSIPPTSIFQRYNLLKEKICGKKMANFIAVVLPWIIAIPLYNGSGYQNIVSWGGVLIVSVVNFIVPIVVYIIALRRSRVEATLSESQTSAVVQRSGSSGHINERRGRNVLSVADAVQWVRSDIAPVSIKHEVLLPSTHLPRVPLSFHTASTSGSSTSPSTSSATGDSASLSSSPVPPSTFVQEVRLRRFPPRASDEEKSLGLSEVALRWAAEADVRKTHKSSSMPSDITQPESGSLRLTQPASLPTFPSTSIQSKTSAQRLLEGMSSSFSGSQVHRERDVEMTGMRSSSTASMSPAQGDSLDFLDTEAVQVEEFDADDDDHPQDVKCDIDEKADVPRAMDTANQGCDEKTQSAVAAVPVAQEVVQIVEGVDADRAEAMDVGVPVVSDTVASVSVAPEVEAVWHAVKVEWNGYRLPVAVGVLALMCALCLLALEQQISSQVENPGWNS